MSIYFSKNRCKFYLKIHLILVCKYRKPLLKDKIDLHIKKIIKYIEKKPKFSIFWKEKAFWRDGYFVSSIGEANPETIRKYIETQG